jgi:imidazolonepropionase-like amidohydrolase
MYALRTILRSIALGLAVLAAGVSSSASDLSIVNATVYTSPEVAPLENGTILIRDGRIAAVGRSLRPSPGSAVIDAHGRTVTAGFWNSHVHIFTHDLLHAENKSSQELSRTLDQMFNRWGFTTVFDIASILENTRYIRNRIDAGEVRGPAIFTTGWPFYPLGGTPIYIRQFLKDEHIASSEPASVEEALSRERQQLSAGADGVKLFAGAIVGGDIGVLPMKLELAKALADEAHRQGKPVFAHPSDARGVDISIASGVDILAHTAPMAGPWNAALIQQLRDRHMALIPTLTLFEVEAKKFGESAEDEAKDMAAARQQLGAFWRAGGEILFGTDAGYIAAYDTTEEYRLMAQAGLDYRAILASLTTNPAMRFGYGKRKGRIAPGMDADLVILEADPAKDPTAFARVSRTIRGGITTYSAAP